MASNAPDDSSAEGGQERKFRLGVLVGGIGTLLSAVLVALIVNLLVPTIKGWFWPEPSPRPAQLEEVRHAIASSGGRTIFAKEADLHGTNVKSQVLVLTNRGGGAELWILDENDGWLSNEFRFRPGHLAPLPGTRFGRYGMEIADISDLDEDGAEELVLLLLPQWRIARGGEKVLERGPIGLLGLGAPDMQIPILIRWNHEASEYGLVPLISEKPNYEVVPFYGPQERARSEFYQRPFWLRDPGSGKRWRAYGGQVSRIVRNGAGQPFLLTAYPARWGRRETGTYGFSLMPTPNCGPPVELRPGVFINTPCGYSTAGPGVTSRPGPDVLSLSAGRIDTASVPPMRSCTFGGIYFVRAGLDAAQATEGAWRRLQRRSAC